MLVIFIKILFYVFVINIILVYPFVLTEQKGAKAAIITILTSFIGTILLMFVMIAMWVFLLYVHGFNIKEALQEVKNWKKRNK